MSDYRLAPAAVTALEQIWLFGQQRWGIEKADAFYHDFFRIFEEIAQNPFMFPKVDHIRSGYRRRVHASYSIYYRVDGDWVSIMDVIGRQDLEQKLS